MGASRRQIMLKYVLPYNVPHLLVAFVLSTPYAFSGVILGEMVLGGQGLGQLMITGVNHYDPATVFSAGLTIAIVSTALTSIGRRMASRWTSDRGMDALV